MVYDGLDAGDETRRNGDYVGLPHADSDGTARDSVTVDTGQLVGYDGSNITKVTASGNDIFGVVYAYDVYGDTGQEEISDNDVTVKTSGTAIVDFSDWGTTPSAGDALGNNGEVLVLEASDSGTDHFEVLLR